jgi:hypothetical protein
MSAFDDMVDGEESHFGEGKEPGEQGSVEWLYERVGYATCSEYSELMEKRKDGKESAARRTYRIELTGERLTGQPSERFVSKYMKWGTEQEAAARMAYEAQTGALVVVPGFTKHPTIAYCGGSVDGLVDDDGIIEIKCPATKTHIETLLAGSMPEEHQAQTQGYLWITRRAWCDYVSYDPRMPHGLQLFVRRIARNDAYIAALAAEVQTFLDEVALQVTALHRLAAIAEIPERAAGGQPKPAEVSSLSPPVPPASPPESSGAQVAPKSASPEANQPTLTTEPALTAGPYITPEDALALEARCAELGIVQKFKASAKIAMFSHLELRRLDGACDWIERHARAT